MVHDTVEKRWRHLDFWLQCRSWRPGCRGWICRAWGSSSQRAVSAGRQRVSGRPHCFRPLPSPGLGGQDVRCKCETAWSARLISARVSGVWAEIPGPDPRSNSPAARTFTGTIPKSAAPSPCTMPFRKRWPIPTSPLTALVARLGDTLPTRALPQAGRHHQDPSGGHHRLHGITPHQRRHRRGKWLTPNVQAHRPRLPRFLLLPPHRLSQSQRSQARPSSSSTHSNRRRPVFADSMRERLAMRCERLGACQGFGPEERHHPVHLSLRWLQKRDCEIAQMNLFPT